MPFLKFSNVSYSVANLTILDHITFDVERGESLVLLGPSGSGKTTILRLINRMLDPTDGSIEIDGKDIRTSDPVEQRRRIGYVMQEFGLLPHWTVRRNIELVPFLLGWASDRRRSRATELIRELRLENLEERLPHQLSGGQRQRVGVARALAAEPSLLLFDEPFGALDPVIRHELQRLFVSIRENFHGASVFVTHDVLEAVAVGTRIGVISGGKLEGIFGPDEFLRATSPVARSFLDTLPEVLRTN